MKRKFTDFSSFEEFIKFVDNVDFSDFEKFDSLRDIAYMAYLKMLLTNVEIIAPFLVFEYGVDLNKDFDLFYSNIGNLLFRLVRSWYEENNENKDKIIFSSLMTFVEDKYGNR